MNDPSTPTTAPVLDVQDVSVRFGGLTAVEQASFTVSPGRVTALIGPNGAGKSTLLNVLSGFLEPDAGRVFYRGEDVTGRAPHTGPKRGYARTFQDLEVLERLTVCENVLLATQDQPGERLSQLVLSPRAWIRRRRRDVANALEVLGLVGLRDRADVLASDLAFGQQKQLVLARLIATDADLLMLDEPGAGLPSSSIDRVGQLLHQVVREQGKSVLLVDHNMQLVLNYASQIVVLHHGRVVATGTPDEIRQDPEVVRVYLSQDPSVTHAAAAERGDA